MTTIERILYATDLSATSEPAWDEARRLGRLLGAEILLLHVVPPPPFLHIEGCVPSQMYEDLLGSARRDAQERFDRLLGSVAGSGLKTRCRLEEGPPAQRFLEVATQEAADILVVGTHGRTGLERLPRQRRRPDGAPGDLSGPDGPVHAGRRTPRRDPPDLLRHRLLADRPGRMALGRRPRRRQGAKVDLVHVTFEPIPDPHLPSETIGRMAQLLHDQGRAEAERFLDGQRCPATESRCASPKGSRASRSCGGPKTGTPTSSSWAPTGGRASSAGCWGRSRIT